MCRGAERSGRTRQRLGCPRNPGTAGAIFKSVAEGYPFMEIREVFGLTLQQLMAILQFAAEGCDASRS